MKLHYITHAHDLKAVRNDSQSANRQRIAAALDLILIVCTTMHQTSVYSVFIIRPLLLNKDQRPLTRAERVMLHAGKRQIILLVHPITSHRTPSGRPPSSIVTA